GVAGQRLRAAWLAAGALSQPIVGAHPVMPGQAVLDVRPDSVRVPEPGEQDHGRPPGSGAVDSDPRAADVNLRRRYRRCRGGCGYARGGAGGKRHNRHCRYVERSPHLDLPPVARAAAMLDPNQFMIADSALTTTLYGTASAVVTHEWSILVSCTLP